MTAPKTWSAAEESLVTELWRTHSHAQLAELLPGRTATAIKARGFKLGLCKPAEVWTPEEDAYLKTNYANTEDDVLAAHLNVSVSAVRSRAYLLGCKKDAAYRTAKILQGMKNRPGKKSKQPHQRSGIKNGKVVKVRELPTGPRPWLEPMNSAAYQNWMQSKVAGTVRIPFTDSAGRVAYRYARQG